MLKCNYVLIAEIVVIHTFAVGSIGKGMGKDIFDYILKEAKKNNKKNDQN